MSPSRRQLLGAVGTAVALSGCTAFESVPEMETETETEREQSAVTAIRARLLGPETDRVLFDGSDIVRVGEVTDGTAGFGPPVELSDSATMSVSEQFRELNVSEDPTEFEIRMLDEDGLVTQFSVGPGLAERIEAGEWTGEMVLTHADRDSAEETRARLVGEDEKTAT